MSEIIVHGHCIELPGGRSVFLARREDGNYLRFINNEVMTHIKLSDEALDALVLLAKGEEVGTQFWELRVPVDGANPESNLGGGSC